MTGFFIFLHTIISILLLTIILMQSGRGGGLTESFASAESMFGAKTNEFMIKATTVFASLFLVTCLGLAILSSQKGKSLMSGKIASEAPVAPAAEEADDVIEEIESIVVGDESVTEIAPEELKQPVEAIADNEPVSVDIPENQ